MSTALLIDNWTLQDVERLLGSGLSQGVAAEISVPTDGTGHRFDPVLAGLLELDALLTLITNIVCFDSLRVDRGFAHAWQRDGGFLSPLEHISAIQVDDYQPFGDELNRVREAVLEQLCTTDSLRKAMAEIKAQWRQSGAQPDPHLSALVWGGAGMLARSHLTSTPYFGHPVRRRLFAQTPALAPNPGSVRRFDSFVNTARAQMFQYRDDRFGGSVGRIVLPPIPVLVIEESSSPHDLIATAVQMRDQHSHLREWLAEYQRAIDEEDERKQIRFENKLVAVGRSLQTMYGAEKDGSVGVSLSTTFLKVDAQRSLLDGIANRFGIRSTLSKFMLAPRGHNAVVKLIGMFGDPSTAVSRGLLTACEARFGLNPSVGT
jgi:hypothetical protein